jgi:hypothetical protein
VVDIDEILELCFYMYLTEAEKGPNKKLIVQLPDDHKWIPVIKANLDEHMAKLSTGIRTYGNTAYLFEYNEKCTISISKRSDSEETIEEVTIQLD